MNTFCRVCLKADPLSPMHPLADKTTRLLFVETTQIELRPVDFKKGQLCGQCLRQCLQWKLFKFQAVECNQRLIRLDKVRKYQNIHLLCGVCMDVVPVDQPHTMASEETRKIYNECQSVVIWPGEYYRKYFCVACFKKCVLWSDFRCLALESDQKVKKLPLKRLHLRIAIYPSNSVDETAEEEIQLKPFQCADCGARFKQHSNLVNHGLLKLCKGSPSGICKQEFKMRSAGLKHQEREKDETLTFKCDECEKTFRVRFALDKHKQIHTEPIPSREDQKAGNSEPQLPLKGEDKEKPFWSDDEDNSFNTEPQKMDLPVISKEKKPFQCETCKKTFKSRRYLTVHQLSHTAQKSFECGDCQKSFFTNQQLIKHQRTHKTDKTFECETCHKTFSTRYYLKQHERVHTGEKRFLCAECPKALATKQALDYHQRTHTGENASQKPYQCKICNESFKHSKNLTIHRRTHTGEDPFKCGDCGKSCPDRYALKVHQRNHTGERPFTCDRCGKSFKILDRLTTHKRIHTGETPYLCETCGKSFAQKSTLNNHVLSHTKGHPVRRSLPKSQLQCEFCHKSFRTRQKVIAHVRTHTGEKPFQCDDCPKSFAMKGSLTEHRRIHSGEKPYECKICFKAFSCLSNLKAHQRTHTGKAVKTEQRETSADIEVSCPGIV